MSLKTKTKDEALKMAIEALLYGTDHTNAVKACKEALEQPAQNTMLDAASYILGKFDAHPHQWQGLTDDEILDLKVKHVDY
jgi:hypothetical protein